VVRWWPPVYFETISNRWGYHHVVSSPHYPQSNEKVETAVQCMEKLHCMLAGQGDHWIKTNSIALLQYRNTPSRKDGLSPANTIPL